MSVNILGKEYPIATTTYLDLSYNKLTKIRVDKKQSFLSSPMVMNRKSETFSIHAAPESIIMLTNLEILDLSNNNLTSLSESIGSLSNLKTLYLSYNNLTSLPNQIGSLSNLQLLFLVNNNLTSLPESIRSLYNLQVLFLHDNNLTSIPESITILTKIKDFVLDESSYDINNLSMDCHTLILTDIKNNITNLPPILRTLYLKHCVNVDMIKLPYGCDIIRF